LEKADAIDLKRQKEAAFEKETEGVAGYKNLMQEFKMRYDVIEKYAFARSFFVEIPYRKMEMVGFANRFRSAVNKAMADEKVDDKEVERLNSIIQRHFKDYDFDTDLDVSTALLKMYRMGMGKEFMPSILNNMKPNEQGEYLAKIMNKSIFKSQEEITDLVKDFDEKSAKKIAKDPIYKLMTQFWDIYFDEVRPQYSRLDNEIDSLSKIYVKGLRDHVAGTYYPDANSTLRLAYGQVDDYEPRDGVDYTYFTTADGILEKYDPENVDFDSPKKLVSLIENKDYGQYADKDGSLHVCFTASNHTTGGNSGSPVINGYGELIGLNFDRNWEGTMSDINYDIDQCRNISVDVRYMLFIVDKYAGAKHLIKEMKLVRTKGERADNGKSKAAPAAKSAMKNEK